MDRSISPEVQKNLVYYLGNRLLHEILDTAVTETGAKDWGGNTGCFQVAFESFEETWDMLIAEGCELSQACSTAVREGILQGTIREQSRLGSAWVTPVRNYVKENWHEAPTFNDPMITDATSVGSIWNTVRYLFERDIEHTLPPDLLLQDFAD